MGAVKLYKNQESLFEGIPWNFSDSEVLVYLQSNTINSEYINILKTLTEFKDDILSNWFNVSVKTFRSYKEPDYIFKENTKEQLVLLVSLMKHGLRVFDTKPEFEQWLSQPNFYFDSQPPLTFLTTVSGIHFVDDRLTALEFGDNV